jgi:DDB1- and CUL4-associated factor 6
MLAVSGIDNTVKIFSADARARRDAALGVSVKAADDSRFSFIGLRNNRRRQSSRTPARRPSDRKERSTHENDDDDDYGSADEKVAEDGLESRKRMAQEYHITSENDMNRRTGMHSTYISRGVMQLLAARFNGQLGEGAADATDDNCRIM